MIKNFVLMVMILALMAANVMAGHRQTVRHRQGRHGTSTRVYSTSNTNHAASASYRASTSYGPKVQFRVRSSGCPNGNCP